MPKRAKRKTPAAPTSPARRWMLLAAALLPLLVYWPTTWHGFLLDDFVLFQKSPSLRDLGSIPRGFLSDVGAARKGFETAVSSYYRPVFLALSTLYYQIGGGDPADWHAANAVLAGLIGWLVCWFFLRLGVEPWISLLASLVFSLHPSHVSSVAWASGLQELLAALFVFGALHALLSVKEEDRTLPIALAALFYVLALLSKEVAAGLLPFVVVWAFVESGPEARRLRRAAGGGRAGGGDRPLPRRPSRGPRRPGGSMGERSRIPGIAPGDPRRPRRLPATPGLAGRFLLLSPGTPGLPCRHAPGLFLSSTALGLALTVPIFTYFAHTIARAAQGQRSGVMIQLGVAMLLLLSVTLLPRLWQARKRKERYWKALERRRGRRGGMG